MNIEYKHLDELAKGRSKMVVFDCEFWHVKVDEPGDYILNKDSDFFFMPREFGGFVLTKQSRNVWKYKHIFFASLGQPSEDVALPISRYSTVSKETITRLNEIEKSIGIGWGDAFPSILNDEQKQLHKEAIKIYENDEYIVKNKRDPKEWYTKFVDLWSDSTIVVKGKGDVDAIRNACMFYDVPYMGPSEVEDIALWNPDSYKKCKTAKLEGTYKCIRPDFDKGIKEIEKILPVGKAHDPSADAAMTFLVALYIKKIGAPVTSFWSNIWNFI
jgi:hypothetical protein